MEEFFLREKRKRGKVIKQYNMAYIGNSSARLIAAGIRDKTSYAYKRMNVAHIKEIEKG